MTCIAILGYIPIMMPMLSVIGQLIVGIPMMFCYTKTNQFGMITIMEIIIGVYLCIIGFLADLVEKSGGSDKRIGRRGSPYKYMQYRLQGSGFYFYCGKHCSLCAVDT